MALDCEEDLNAALQDNETVIIFCAASWEKKCETFHAAHGEIAAALGVPVLVLDMDEPEGEEAAIDIGCDRPGAFLLAYKGSVKSIHPWSTVALSIVELKAALNELAPPNSVECVLAEASAAATPAISASDPGPPVHLVSTQLCVQGICCSAEVNMVKNLLNPLPGVASVGVNQVSRTAIVSHVPSLSSPETLVDTLNRARLGAARRAVADRTRQ